MTPFFIEDKFYSDIEDYLSDNDLQREDIEKLPDDYKLVVMGTREEPVLTLTLQWMSDAVTDKAESYDDRFPEDSEDVFQRISNAVRQSVDIDKLNTLMPRLWYPDDSEFEITKQDLLDAC